MDEALVCSSDTGDRKAVITMSSESDDECRDCQVVRLSINYLCFTFDLVSQLLRPKGLRYFSRILKMRTPGWLSISG